MTDVLNSLKEKGTKKVFHAKTTAHTETKAQSYEEKKAEALAVLKDSMENGTILTGYIEGVETINGKGPSIAVLYMNDYKIIIPAEDCIEIGDSGDRDPKKYEQYLLGKRLASEIEYVVKTINEADETVLASRKEAMNRSKEAFFEMADGNYVINEGDDVEARVVCTTRAGIIVEINGVETYILSRELSYQRIQDAAQLFYIGTKVMVKIISLSRNENTMEVSLDASVKQTYPEPYTKAMKRFHEGDKYVGTVSMVDSNGVFVALPGEVDVLCKFPDRGIRPSNGSTVTVRITTKVEEQNRLFGLITAVARV